jgi:zinc D-Ala-D-Ala carboxypeptidase
MIIRMIRWSAAVLVFLVLVGCSKPAAQQNGPAEKRERELVHPAFSMTLADVRETISPLPPDIQANILMRPQYFMELVDQALTLSPELLRLVDKAHALPSDYEPDDLVSLAEYDVRVNRSDLTLRRGVMPDVLAMVEAARSDDIELVFSSCYRSYSYQETVYKRHIEQLGEEQANRESAKPGTSQHQLGTTIDFGSITPAFGDTPAGKWLYRHAWKYGFSLSYPAGLEELTGYMHEIWHYRYISRVGTELEQQFFNGIQQHLLSFWNAHKNRFVDASLSHNL